MTKVGSYFKGWSSLNPASTTLPPTTDSVEPLFGQVLEVIYESTNQDGVGLIRVKIYNQGTGKDEDGITSYAYPADRNIMKYPVPGEIVLLKHGVVDSQSDGHMIKALFYTTVLSSAGNITFNSNPYYLERVPRSDASSTFTPEFEKRFESRLVNVESFIENGKVKSRPQLQPFEGDFIIQSRWGSTIRLGSTGFKEKNQWSKKGGLSGNPITIIRATRSNGEVTVVEDIDKDDSSIYMCSTQVIPVTLSVSAKMKSLAYTYDVPVSPAAGGGGASTGGGLKFIDDTTAFEESVWIEMPVDPGGWTNQDVAAEGGWSNNTQVNTGDGSATLGEDAFKGRIKNGTWKRVPGTNIETTFSGTKFTNLTALAQAAVALGVTDAKSLIGYLGCSYKECGFEPKNEYGYNTTGNARLRELFGKRLKRFNEDQLTELKKDNSKFYDYIYGCFTEPKSNWNNGNDQPGDGWKYRGRGFNQITFKSLYKKYGDKIGVDLVSNPDKLNDVNVAAKAGATFLVGGMQSNKKLGLNPNGFKTVFDAALGYVKINAGGSGKYRQEGLDRAMAGCANFRPVGGVPWVDDPTDGKPYKAA